eukprot:2751242-Pyramimonas_sp.AAC.1
MDVHGSPLMDVMWPPTNPFLQTQSAFTEMLCARPDEGPLSTLFFQYGVDPAGRDKLMSDVRDLVLCMAGQVSFFFEDVFGAFPAASDGRPPMVAIRLDASRNTPLCDLDPDLSVKVFNLYASSSAMSQCPELKACLVSWGKIGRLTSMDVERVLKEIKTASSCPSSDINFDRIVSAGALTQYLTRHVLRYEGSDPRVVTRKQLLEDGGDGQCCGVYTAASCILAVSSEL